MYLTFKKQSNQITLNDLYNLAERNETAVWEEPTTQNITVLAKPNIDLQALATKYNLNEMKQKLDFLYLKHADLYSKNLNELYTSFQIPKRKGGFRQIDAPLQELMQPLREFKNFLEYDLKLLNHNAAYAYTKNRCCKSALEVHQKAESRWFLKLDISDFFPSITEEIIMQQLKQIFPLAILLEDFVFKTQFTTWIKCCLLNGVLPQGTPTSPILSNLIMLPYDDIITKTLWNFDRQTFKYTRYADDMLISCKYNFDFNKVENKINELITPFNIKQTKTRYGSRAGQNWNLGLMLNKDNHITVGYKRKERYRAALFNFIKDFTNQVIWDIIDVQILVGQIAYLQNIEPEYAESMLQKYENKFCITFKEAVKQTLNR